MRYFIVLAVALYSYVWHGQVYESDSPLIECDGRLQCADGTKCPEPTRPVWNEKACSAPVAEIVYDSETLLQRGHAQDCPKCRMKNGYGNPFRTLQITP